MAATIDATPNRKKMEVNKKFSIPNDKKISVRASIKDITIQIFMAVNICLGEIPPLCMARSGPFLSLLSVPLIPSP